MLLLIRVIVVGFNFGRPTGMRQYLIAPVAMLCSYRGWLMAALIKIISLTFSSVSRPTTRPA